MDNVTVMPDADLLPIDEAARRLRTTPEALRKRIQRGKVQADRGPDGKIWVYVPRVAGTNGDTGLVTTEQEQPIVRTMEVPTVGDLIKRLEDQAGVIAVQKAQIAEMRKEIAYLDRKVRRLEMDAENSASGRDETESD
jgi:hypothetical protein